MNFSTKPGWTTFKTAIGYCGIAWTEKGFDRLVLPLQTRAETEEEISLTLAGRPRNSSPPANVAGYISRVKDHLAGKSDNLSDLPVDLTRATPFSRLIYTTLRTIETGCTASYGQLATLAGKPGAARAVGRAMGANPLPLIIPCHRVLPATGGLGGFSAHGGIELKARLLHLEGVSTARHN